MALAIEIDVDVAHQLRQLRRDAVFPDHLGADADDPQKLRLLAIAEVDLLHAGGAFHRPIFAVDRVDRGEELRLLDWGRRSQKLRRGDSDAAADEKEPFHVLKNST